MGKIKSFEDLEVWRRSHIIVVQLYRITQNYPRDELYGITSQIRRAAISVPNNIAEGAGRYSTKDFIRFLIQARGSLNELSYLIMLSKDLNFINIDDQKPILKEINEIGKMLNAMINSLRKRLTTSH